MPTFRVAFDGDWQEEFDTLADAMEWAREVSRTGRLSWVIEHRRFCNRFRAAFPQERTEEAIKAWKRANGWAQVLASFGGGFG